MGMNFAKLDEHFRLKLFGSRLKDEEILNDPLYVHCIQPLTLRTVNINEQGHMILIDIEKQFLQSVNTLLHSIIQ